MQMTERNQNIGSELDIGYSSVSHGWDSNPAPVNGRRGENHSINLTRANPTFVYSSQQKVYIHHGQDSNQDHVSGHRGRR